MMATAPGKLILTGEYAVLDGAPALVVAVDRRVTATHEPARPRGSSPFMLAVADALAKDYPAAARMVSEISVDSSAFYQDGQKLGLGSSAAVTVAATALALVESSHQPLAKCRDAIFAIALAAHANAQGTKGARGSGADIAAAVYGGSIVFQIDPTRDVEVPMPPDDIALLGGDPTAARTEPTGDHGHARLLGSSHVFRFAPPQRPISISHRQWPASVRLLPFFTGGSADTATLVARVAAARTERPDDVEAALAAVAAASNAICDLLVISGTRDADPAHLIAGFRLAAAATTQLGRATGVDLVPDCVTRVAAGLAALGGTAKTTGAGGGDIGIAVIPATADVTLATRIIIQQGCQPLPLALDDTGVDTHETAQ